MNHLKRLQYYTKEKLCQQNYSLTFTWVFMRLMEKKHITTLTIYSPDRCQLNWKTRIRYVSRHNYLMESFQYWRDFLTERFQKVCRSVFPIFIDLVIFLSSLSYFDLKIAFFIFNIVNTVLCCDQSFWWVHFHMNCNRLSHDVITLDVNHNIAWCMLGSRKLCYEI